MSGTTTIEVYDEQKDELDDLKLTDSESYKDVLQRLIDGHIEGAGDVDEDRIREIVRDEVSDKVIPEAQR